MDSNKIDKIRENAVMNSKMYKQALEMGVPKEEAFEGTMNTLHVLSAVFMSAIHAAIENDISSAELADHMDLFGEAALTAFYNAGGNDPKMHELLAMAMAVHDMEEEKKE